MKDLKKIVEDHLNAEINKFLSNLTYHTVNRMIDYMRQNSNEFIDIEKVNLETDDDGLISVNIVLRKKI